MSSSDTNFDALMVDWLYDELDPAEAKSFEDHLETHPEARAEASALKRTRAAFQELEEAEPPSALSAILMHEAAQAAEPKLGGLWASFSALFQPIFMHPAASAMATLVVVVGVAGALYSRKGDMAVQPTAVAVADKSELREDPQGAPAAVSPTTISAWEESPAEEEADMDEPEPSAEQNGYRVGLAGDNAEGAITAAAQDSRYLAEEKKTDLSKSTSRGARGKKGEANKDFAFDGEADKPGDIAFGSGTFDSKNANAISGGRGFAQPPGGPVRGLERASVDSSVTTENERSRKESKSKKKARADVAKKAPQPPPVPTNRESKQGTSNKPKQEAPSWELQQTATLKAAAKQKRCRDAGRIANDILDRTPSFYKKQVAGTKAVSDCHSQVASETQRRAKSRSKRAAKTKKAAGVPSKANAAPQPDELSADGL